MGDQQPNVQGVSGSIGRTALIVARARALESMSSHPLVTDPFAADLIRSTEFAVRDDVTETGGLADYVTYVVAVRTRFVDDVIVDATGRGVRQVVILGAGLDSRAFRIPWPAGLHLYELDQPRLMEFKEDRIRFLGAQARCTRTAVAGDLRGEWLSALTQAGLDLSESVAWVAEGLVFYLPAPSQEDFFSQVTSFRTPQTHLCFDMMSPTMLQSVMKGPGRQAIEDEYSLDPADFLDRHIFDYESWLPDHGWDLSTATLAAVGRGYQREPRADALQLANEYVLAKAVIST